MVQEGVWHWYTDPDSFPKNWTPCVMSEYEYSGTAVAKIKPQYAFKTQQTIQRHIFLQCNVTYCSQ